MPSQTSINISLPESMRQWVESRVETDGYGTVSEYVRALVRDDQKRKSRDQMDQKLLEAFNSGEPLEMTPADWQQIRSTVRNRLAKPKRK